MIVVKIIFILLLGLILVSVFNLINNISILIQEKTKYQSLVNEKEVRYDSKMSVTERLDVSIDLLNLCDQLVDKEIMKTLRSYVLLNTRYDMHRIDKDAELISTNVYSALKSEALIDPDLLLSTDCYLRYITDETIVRLITTVKNYNSIISK